ncbi:MAG: hypothetical protein M3128_03690 [Verrucomicrobiota bacterium]|nr:hypothetical protein [Verrucomicrobiota bacterium]
MMRRSFFIVGMALATSSLFAQGPTVSPGGQPTINQFAERYVRLALALGQHDPDYVDAYYGPAEWKTEVAAEKKSLGEIQQTAHDLSAALLQTRRPTSDIDRLRFDFLQRQLAALEARTDIVQGEKKSFDDEARALYDAAPPTFPEEHFEDILAQLEKKIPGQGPLSQRYEEWHKAFIIPTDKLDTVFQLAIKECRARSLAHIKLPPNEGFKVEYVTNKPWGGYNWYKGDYQSVIQVNTDLPAYIDRAIDLAAHEGYPGHHVYNALLEKNLVREHNFVEFSIYPLFSPQSLIAEGTANFGREVVFNKAERMMFEKNVLWPAAGLDPGRAEEYYAVQDMTRELSYAANEAARKLVNGEIDSKATVSWLQKYALMDEARAQQRVRFIQRYRSYVINYNLGEDIVRSYIEKKGGTPEQPAKRWHEFELLLSAPHLPSELEQTIR